MLRELLRPDAFVGDWYGWLTNQASHVLVGAVLAMLLSLRLRPRAALLVAAAGYGLVEVAQLALHGPGLWADGLADLGFAALGALIVAAWRRGGCGCSRRGCSPRPSRWSAGRGGGGTERGVALDSNARRSADAS